MTGIDNNLLNTGLLVLLICWVSTETLLNFTLISGSTAEKVSVSGAIISPSNI